MSETRMTRQRALILKVLRGVSSHPTAAELLALAKKEMPRLSLGTVYRNLDLLVSSGEILCLERNSSNKRFDGNTVTHYHVRCQICGRVADISEHTQEDVPLPKVPGFCVKQVLIDFEGVCDVCSQKH